MDSRSSAVAVSSQARISDTVDSLQSEGEATAKVTGVPFLKIWVVSSSAAS